VIFKGAGPSEPSLAQVAIHKQRPITNKYSSKTTTTPIQPHSSLNTEKAKSMLCCCFVDQKNTAESSLIQPHAITVTV